MPPRRFGWTTAARVFIVVTVALTTPPAKAHAATKAIGFDNVHIRSLDPARAAEWYVSALGAAPSEPPAPGTAQVTFSGQVVTITKGTAIEPSMGTAIDHFGLSVADLDAAVKRAESAGATVTTSPRESPGFFRYAYIVDPWGSRIELVEDSERLGFHHVHLRARDPDMTLAWFEQRLGGERAKLRGKLDGVRFGGVWVFAMNSGAETPPAPTAIQVVAVRVDDVEASARALSDAGIKMLSEPRTLPALTYAFFEGPNGIRVEVVKRLKTP